MVNISFSFKTRFGSGDRTRGHSRSGIQVWLAGPWSNLIGQPFYNTRPILRRVASVAGALATATLVHLWEGCNP